MAFTHTIGRYASVATVQTIPNAVIDSFWYVIDNNLKDVFDLDPIINFELLNHNGKLSIRFTQDSDDELQVDIDLDIKFDTNWPSHFYAVDNLGRETIVMEMEI